MLPESNTPDFHIFSGVIIITLLPESPNRCSHGRNIVTSRFQTDEQYLVAWRRGLRFIVLFYVGIAVTSPVTQYVRNAVAASDVRISAINRQSTEAFEKRDLAAITETNDRLEDEVKKQQFLRLVTFSAAGLSIGGLCLLVLGTWMITQQPISRWERAVRYAAIMPLVLIPLIATGVKTEGLNLLILLVSIVILTGHEVAVRKIAVHTGNSEIDARLHWAYFCMRILVVALSLTRFIATLHFVSKGLIVGVLWVVMLGMIAATFVQAATIWELSGKVAVAGRTVFSRKS